MNINELLSLALERKASDLHLKVGAPPVLRINGEIDAQQDIGLVTEEDINALFLDMTNDEQRVAFAENLEADFAYSAEGLGRFRVNVCQECGTVGMTCRPVRTDIPSIEELGLPPVCRDLVSNQNGLVIITGPTGCGKSTTLAAMINHLNQTTNRKIITIEDPVEYMHRDNRCIFFQRELGRDTWSFANALKHALRQDPDVILVGEMRDLETMSAALTAAETGHLVLATLHTQGTPEAIDRFIDVFPPYQQQQVRIQLSITLRGVLYQVLVPKADYSGRVAAIEVMMATHAIKNLIREGKTHQMMNAIQTGVQYGMQTLNQSLAAFCEQKMITREEAMSHSTDTDGLREILGGQPAYL